MSGWNWISITLLIAIVAVGCGSATPPPSRTPLATPVLPLPTMLPVEFPTVKPSPTAGLPAATDDAAAPSPTPTAAQGDQMTPDPDARRLAAQARSDLAQRLTISADSIRLTRTEAVEWPDTSLGCPKPGFMYAQVVTPGYRIVLEAGGKTYEYHSDRQQVSLCEK